MDTTKKQQTVWTLKDGQPAPVPITVGASDGTMTEVVSGDVKPDMPLIVDMLGSGR